MTGMEDAAVSVAGHLLAVRRGAGDRPLVVFVSAMGQSLTDWTAVIDRLDSRPATLAYDRPGIGGTPPRPAPKPPIPYTGFAAELAELLDALGLVRPVVLVGHSFGSLIVRALAQRWPRRVAGMVHVDGSLPTFVLGKRREAYIDGEDERTGTVIDIVTDAALIADAQPPQVPTVVLSRAVGWDYPPPAVAPPDQDARWHGHHADLARRSGGVRLVAHSAGHQLPREAPDLVALAVDAVVNAVRAGQRTVSLDPVRVRAADGYVAS
jgi:pimeloyl-ACP methyl ester carboxylesterase